MAREGKPQRRSRYETRPLKRVVVKEEFVALTGDHEKALILAQLEYWHARPQEIDKYLHEELDRARRSGADITHTIQPTEGWIYKDAEELSEETMLSLSRQTMRRRLKDLVDSGWVLQRNNPHHTWDQTLQYRLDLLKIRDDLRKIGYELQGWVLNVEEETGSGEDSEDSEPCGEPEPGAEGDSAKSKLDIAESKLNIATSRMIFRMSSLDDQMLSAGLAIPEITSEITTERDLPSVDPSAHATPAHENNPADSEAGPTDRPTDGSTDEEPSGQTSGYSTSMQLLEPEDAHYDESGEPSLSPKEDEVNAAPRPEEALRQQAEAIPTSEISEQAQDVAAGLLNLLPKMEKADSYRVMRLAEHYHRKERSSVLAEAAEKVAKRAERTKIEHPWSYLTKTCAEKESYYSEEDEALLKGLSGRTASSSSEESKPAGYEWFFSDSDQESDGGEDHQRQHTPEPDPEALEVWEKVLEDVAGEINAPSLGVWFEGTVPISFTGESLTISVPNTFAREYIESRFKELLEAALSKRLRSTAWLEIVVKPTEDAESTSREEESSREDKT